MNKFVFLFIILLLSICLPFFIYTSKFMEGYTNYNLAGAQGEYPNAQTEVLVQNTYPAIGKNKISNNTAYDIWWHLPVFKLGSYDQITNNIRYPNNPDVGTCMPASMCGALYHEKFIKTNYVKPLPPLDPNKGTRVGYFDTDYNLLPFRNNMSNILY